MRPRIAEVDVGPGRGRVFDIGADEWVIVLPGANYPADAPLLWFAREAALAAGRNVLAVSGTFDTGGDPVRWVEDRAKAAVRHAASGRPVLVAKSLTSLAAPLAATLGLPAVWLTPLIAAAGTAVAERVTEGLAKAVAPALLIGGTADPTWDGTVARSFSSARVLEIPDADHALQVPGDPGRSLDALRTVTDAIGRFVEGGAPAR